jgi:hypothetical protein
MLHATIWMKRNFNNFYRGLYCVICVNIDRIYQFDFTNTLAFAAQVNLLLHSKIAQTALESFQQFEF